MIAPALIHWLYLFAQVSSSTYLCATSPDYIHHSSTSCVYYIPPILALSSFYSSYAFHSKLCPIFPPSSTSQLTVLSIHSFTKPSHYPLCSLPHDDIPQQLIECLFLLLEWIDLLDHIQSILPNPRKCLESALAFLQLIFFPYTLLPESKPLPFLHHIQTIH